jgi:hypothetical protein
MKNSSYKNEWTQERAFQLRELSKLLSTLSGINDGSDFLGNMHKCVETAERLRSSDAAVCKNSFIEFLTDLCIDERTGKHEIPKQS